MNISLSGIKLNYSYKEVLKDITCQFEAGKIHALLGENGAGKSSLMKILTGFIKPNEGKIFLDSREVVFKKPADSLKNKIACVYQRPYLADSLSVRDNLFIGIKKRNSQIEFLEEIDLNEKVKFLPGDKRFIVAFAASLLRNPEVLILDEPTALLNSLQSEKLFQKLRELATQGMNIIVITHKPGDLRFCDNQFFMKEGVISRDDSLVQNQTSNLQSEDNEKEYFSYDHLTPENCLTLRNHGEEGVAIIPSDRTYLASNPNLTITQLVCSTFNESNPRARKLHTQEIIRRTGINIKPEEKVYNLSGGMLQRLILERELFTNPKIIYLEDPFQGLDSLSCKRLKDRLSLCEKNGSKVVYL